MKMLFKPKPLNQAERDTLSKMLKKLQEAEEVRQIKLQDEEEKAETWDFLQSNRDEETDK